MKHERFNKVNSLKQIIIVHNSQKIHIKKYKLICLLSNININFINILK